MILEIVGVTCMSGLLTYTKFGNGTSEASKIQRIANTCGLTVQEGGKTHTIHLLRRKRHDWGMEYVYRVPLGLSFEDFKKKQQYIEDGLNHKRGILDLTIDDLKSLRIRSDILEQIKKLMHGKKHRKEILLNYDGTLKISIYKEPLAESVPFDESTLDGCDGWKICMGESREGVIHHDFDKIPHLVVAGTTRYGKSVFLKNVITTLIHTQPDSVRITLIDLKGGLAFNRFKDAKQVVEVAKDVNESLTELRKIHTDMVKRQKYFLAKGYEDIKEARMKQRDFIIIDEAAELASQGEPDNAVKKLKVECEHIIAEIARIGGGLGFFLTLCTQYPTADTLPRQVKQNCDAKLCFKLQTDTASRVVLDEGGAEDLPFIKGRGIYQTDRKHIVQTPFIQNDFIDKTIKPHIIIKARKEVQDAEQTTRTDRDDSLVIEDAGLPNNVTNRNVTPFRRRT
ncbi:FtsK/SpoIIIE domain-containing protein [Paenibacillus sp. LjRoot56]|uniref:FtsK/SpoIIIE domain-containing protein n=1 Tax=Paenibacillus sp. LjRoot56 TaxID=3342333 RepID=UPI003ECE1AC3